MVAAGEDRVREDAVDLQPRCELRRHLASCHPRPHGSDRVLERAAAVRPELAHAIRLAGGQPHAQLLQVVGAVLAGPEAVVGKLRDVDEIVERRMEVALVPGNLDHLEPDLARVLLALQPPCLDVARHQIGAVVGHQRREERRILAAQNRVLHSRRDPADKELAAEQHAAAIPVRDVGANALKLLDRLGGTGLGGTHLSSIECERDRLITRGRRLRVRGPRRPRMRRR